MSLLSSKNYRTAVTENGKLIFQKLCSERKLRERGQIAVSMIKTTRKSDLFAIFDSGKKQWEHCFFLIFGSFMNIGT